MYRYRDVDDVDADADVVVVVVVVVAAAALAFGFWLLAFWIRLKTENFLCSEKSTFIYFYQKKLSTCLGGSK